MAVNKRKILDAARKYVQKGAKQKALKEYERLLKLDPKDGKLRLEIGDAHRRWGQVDEATSQYTKVAEQYKQDGFDARSVAVYKQVLNLDPKRYVAYVALSELYQRMGLDAEAIAALQTAADGFHKEGQKREALELLRKMATLDPTNTTSRTKVAELLLQEGLEDDAVAEYEAVAEELERQGSLEQVAVIYARILESRPSRVDVLAATARTLVKLRQPERAEPFAKQAVQAQPDETDYLELLCDVYKALDQAEDLAEYTKQLAKIYRDRGDDGLAREIMQRLPQQGIDLSEDAPAFGTPEDLGGEDDLEDDDLLDDDFLAGDDPDISMRQEAPSPEPASAGDDEEPPQGDPDQLFAEASVYLRYGKRDQAIASLRGILAQEPGHRGALEKLGEAYAEDGDEAAAIEHWSRAADCATQGGDVDAFNVLRDRIAALDPAAAEALAAGVAEDSGDAADASDAGDDALALDLEVEAGEGADSIDVEEDLDDNDESAGEGSLELDLAADDADATDDEGADDDLDFEVDVDEGAEQADLSPAADDSTDDDDSGIEFDIDLDDGSDEASEEQAASDDTGDLDIDIDLDVDGADDLDAAAAAVEEAEEAERSSGRLDPDLEVSDTTGGGVSESASSSPQVADDLEEAEFFFGQGLHDEAEEVYRRILEVAPNHPSALLRLGEILAARGDGEANDEGGALSTPTLDQAADVDGALADDGIEGAADDALDNDGIEVADDEGLALDTEDATETEIEVEEPVAAAADLEVEEPVAAAADLEVEEPVAAAADPEESGVDLAAALAEDLEEELAEEESERIAAAEADSVAPEETQPLAADADGAESEVAEPEEETANAPAEAQEVDEEAMFDLAAELREAIEGEDDHAAASESSTAEEGFDAIFSEFKKGVSQTLTEADTETRYDLGIAYREMGLYDDAITEFRVCLESDGRRLESLTMMGLCALDVGRPADAVSHFEQALASAELPEENRIGLLFDLAQSLEQSGDIDRARSTYEAVVAIDADFRDVGERIAGLDDPSAAASSHDDSDDEEGFESFDDLTAEVAAEDAAEAEAQAEEAEAETFESFDDVITEAEAEIAAGDSSEAEAEIAAGGSAEVTQAEVEVEPEPEPEAETKSKPKGRKKKISFV